MDLLLFAYADARQELPGVKREADFHANLFNRGNSGRQFTFFWDQQADVISLSNWLTGFRDEIFLFHYSGHADHDIIRLADEESATSEGIATLLARCPNLKLVVLNGCSTAGHIAKLRAAGVDAIIIATNWEVLDLTASSFSQNFYAALERGENVERAFDEATGHVLLSGKIEIERGLAVPQVANADEPIWGMYPTAESDPAEIRLPFQKEYSSKPVPVPGHFIGRRANLERMTGKLRAERAVAICIAGPLGIGKSALCRQVLWEERVLKKFGRRIIFVKCESTTSTEDLKFALGDKLGTTPKGDLENQIWEKLNGAPTLIALDNAETPFENDRNKFQQFLQELFGMGNVSLLLTIRGQQIPRGLPWESPIERLSKVTAAEAREIFVANAGRQEFMHDPHLAALLSRLDGHPQALVLMAGQAEIESHLLPLLERWDRTGVSTFSEDTFIHAVEMALASTRMSWQGHRLFRILSILPAGIHRGQLDALTSGYGQDGARALFGTGLATYDELQRLQMPAPIRAYGKDKHHPPVEELMPVIDYFCQMVASTRDLGGKNGLVIAAGLVPELGNIEKIIGRAIDVEPEKGIEAALNLSRFTAFTRLGNTELLVRALKIARALDKKQLIAECLEHLGKINAILTSDYEDSERFFVEALDLSTQTQSDRNRATSLLNLGDFAFFEGNSEQARSYYQEALGVFTGIESLKGMAVCSLRLGDLALQKNDPDEARKMLKQADAYYQKVESVMGRASCLLLLAEIAFQTRKHKKARIRYVTALELVRGIGHVEYIVRCLEGLGKTAFENSDISEALSHYQEAAKIYQENPDLTGRAKCLNNLGEAYLRLPDTEMATEHLQEALELFARDGNHLGEAECKRLLAVVAFENSDYTLAIDLLQDAMSAFRILREKSYAATCQRTLGDIYTFQGDYAQALRLYEEAQILFAEEEDYIGKAECLWGVGDMYFQMEDPAAAREYWQLTVEIYEAIQDFIALLELYEKLVQVTTGEEQHNYIAKVQKLRKKLTDA